MWIDFPRDSSPVLGAEYSAPGRNTGFIKEAVLAGLLTVELGTVLTEPDAVLTEPGSGLKPQLGDEHA